MWLLFLAMICIYEGNFGRNFGPIIDLRAIFELRCGCFSFLEKIQKLYPGEKFFFWVRNEIAALVAEKYPAARINETPSQPALFLYAGSILFEPIPIEGRDEKFTAMGRTIGFRLNRRTGRTVLPDLNSLPAREIAAEAVFYPWDIVRLNYRELQRELNLLRKRRSVFVKKGGKIYPGAQVVTEKGPVFIDQGAEVRPGSVVEGPCYIGPGTIVDGAFVRPGCSFGPQCRIGGEVEECVFQGYANKHHAGFLGHSFVGEWVNLGALTTNSDLKNNYQPVRVTIGARKFETGMVKLGCFIGDHVKTSIGTLLPTGAVLGTFANWFESGLTPKFLPSFAWGKKRRWRRKELVECAQRVMARRGVTMSPVYEQLLLQIYERSR